MAFCIKENYAVTAYHNVIKNDATNGKLYPRLAFCSGLFNGTLIGSSIVVVATSYFDAKDDWIILSPESVTESFPNTIELATVQQLPTSDNPRNNAVRVVNAPIGMYIRDGGSLEVSCETFKMILYYRPDIAENSKDRTIGVKSLSIKSPYIFPIYDPKCVWLTVVDRLHSGACGSPYVDCNHKVVAMHIYSANEASTLHEVVADHFADKEREHASTEAHCDVKEGLVLCKVASFVRTIRKLLNVDINSNIV